MNKKGGFSSLVMLILIAIATISATGGYIYFKQPEDAHPPINNQIPTSTSTESESTSTTTNTPSSTLGTPIRKVTTTAPTIDTSKITIQGKGKWPEFKGNNVTFSYPKDWYIFQSNGEFNISKHNTRDTISKSGWVYINNSFNYNFYSLRDLKDLENDVYESEGYVETTFKGYPAHVVSWTRKEFGYVDRTEYMEKYKSIIVNVEDNIWEIRYKVDTSIPELSVAVEEIASSVNFK